MKKYTFKDELSKMVRNPVAYFFYARLRAILSLPLLLLFKVMNEGLYEVYIIDKKGKVIQKGYIWSENEYIHHRLTRVKNDIKSRHMVFPKGYKIRFIYIDKSPSEYCEKIIWTKNDFKIDKIAKEISREYYSYIKLTLKSLASAIKPVNIKEKFKQRLSLYEIICYDKETVCICRCFMVSSNAIDDYGMINKALEQRKEIIKKKQIKTIELKKYDIKTFNVIWALET